MKNIKEMTSFLMNHPSSWMDPYDTERYSSRIIRAGLKRLAYFQPKLLYKSGLLKHYVWPENYILLGIAALNFNDEETVKIAIQELLQHDKNGWGLPIRWSTGGYEFPPGLLMSTTTSECIHFLIEADKKFQLVNKERLKDIAHNLYHQLQKVQVEGKELLSYTPMDNTLIVFNSNLLVASAIGAVGYYIEDENLIKISEQLVNSIVSLLPENGCVPYKIGGSEETVDGYHQLFSARALYVLKSDNKVANKWYKKIVHYFEQELFEPSTDRVFLNKNKNILDLQSSSEALRLFGLTGEEEKFNRVYNHIVKDLTDKNGNLIQRMWLLSSNSPFNIKAKTAFTRQGTARYLAGVSYCNKI